MNRNKLIFLVFLALGGFSSSAWSDGAADRAYTIEVLRRIADPVMIPAAEGRMKDILATEIKLTSRADRPPDTFGFKS